MLASISWNLKLDGHRLRRQHSKITANAMLIVYMSFDIVIEIEISPIGNATDRFSDNVIDDCETFFVEKLFNPSIMSSTMRTRNASRRADLNRARTSSRIRRIAPSIDPADPESEY